MSGQMRECRWDWHKSMNLSSLSHANIQDLTMARHKKTKKIGERGLKDETKWRAIFLKKEGKLSNPQIAASCKVSPSTVRNLWEKYDESGSMNERNDRRTGAPRKTKPSYYRALRLQESVTDLKLEGKVDAEAYYRLLRHQMRPTMKLQGGRQSFIFMQGIASVHTAKKNLQFLERNNYELLDHPPQPPNLNPLGNIWGAT